VRKYQRKEKMKHTSIVTKSIAMSGIVTTGWSVVFCAAICLCQSGPVAPAATQTAASGNLHYSVQGQPDGTPVSYASVTQLNGMLSQLEAASKNTQADLVKLRIERWKADGATKKEALNDVDSIQRNLQGALPEVISHLRTAPEDVPTSFNLYRNLDALNSVLASIVEQVGAFGGKDDFQSLTNDLNNFEGTRKQMAERITTLASSKEAEIVRLRTDLKTAQAAIPAKPPSKIVVDDTEPAKKPPVKKKPAAKPATTSTKPTAGTQSAPSSQQPPPSKPQ
jgi:hypothetical protein